MDCPDCEKITLEMSTVRALWFNCPTTVSFSKLLTGLNEFGFDCTGVGDKTLCVPVLPDDLELLAEAFERMFTAQELMALKILATDGSVPGASSFGNVVTADTFIAQCRVGWLVETIQKDRFETWYQPIVSAEPGHAPFAHEGLFRPMDQDGHAISPHRVFQTAELAGLLFQLDIVARRSAVQGAGHLPGGKLFINFDPCSIYDPEYCLSETARFIEAMGMRPQDIVFEVTETHKPRDQEHLLSVLRYYRRSGYEVALDDVGAGYSGLTLLTKIRPDYIKIDMELIRHIDKDPYRQMLVQHFIDAGKGNGVRIIAEGIETDAERDWLMRAGVDYLQGFLLGRPMPLHPVTRGRRSSHQDQAHAPAVRPQPVQSASVIAP